jgi:glutathione S-transferase
MMLSAAHVNHWVVLYDAVEDDANGWNMDTYVHDKAWLKTEYNPLMNLPYLVDVHHNVVISQTNAIFTYLGRQLGLLGSNPYEETKREELLCEVMDLRNQMTRFCYSSDGSLAQAQHLRDQARAHFRKLEHHLQQTYPDRKHGSICHLVGSKFSAPDFHLFEMLDQFKGLCQFYDLSLLEDFPLLLEFHANFAALPENAPYLKSFCHTQLPYNNVMAVFASGGSGGDPDHRVETLLGTYVRGQVANWRKKGVCVENRGGSN